MNRQTGRKSVEKEKNSLNATPDRKKVEKQDAGTSSNCARLCPPAVRSVNMCESWRLPDCQVTVDNRRAEPSEYCFLNDEVECSHELHQPMVGRTQKVGVTSERPAMRCDAVPGQVLHR